MGICTKPSHQSYPCISHLDIDINVAIMSRELSSRSKAYAWPRISASVWFKWWLVTNQPQAIVRASVELVSKAPSGMYFSEIYIKANPFLKKYIGKLLLYNIQFLICTIGITRSNFIKTCNETNREAIADK